MLDNVEKGGTTKETKDEKAMEYERKEKNGIKSKQSGFSSGLPQLLYLGSL